MHNGQMAAGKSGSLFGQLAAAASGWLDGLQRLGRMIRKVLSHPHALIVSVDIAWIVDPSPTRPAQEFPYGLAPRRKKGAQQPAASIEQNGLRHAREPKIGIRLAADSPHRDRFQLVVQRVPGNDDIGFEHIGSLHQQEITRFPCCSRDSGLGLFA
ncbi:hypothetical protein D3C80_711680 [compost metagenome]